VDDEWSEPLTWIEIVFLLGAIVGVGVPLVGLALLILYGITG
jgi:hypothetical protein